MQSVNDRVIVVIGDTFGLASDDISLEDTADDIDGWDSLNHVTLMLRLSREFGIHIQPTETEGLANVGALVEFIQSKIA
ncbi:hypothetical protein ASG19_21690 [Rhizobium sp. Leaf306]|uniref:acyl carrier protein n=1 Tax=Rhizobium sp. Leaf306 TaxID=1736330 RepID=UPI00071264E4|nr:acyl carrier protein [Rhizobium sp. Leaf306]KQQ33906.1 hypothetical protein ASG19_21690 [Rhizobium sp. Leaf306]